LGGGDGIGATGQLGDHGLGLGFGALRVPRGTEAAGARHDRRVVGLDESGGRSGELGIGERIRRPSIVMQQRRAGGRLGLQPAQHGGDRRGVSHEVCIIGEESLGGDVGKPSVDEPHQGAVDVRPAAGDEGRFRRLENLVPERLVVIGKSRCHRHARQVLIEVPLERRWVFRADPRTK
jgi:hypothetical protein